MNSIIYNKQYSVYKLLENAIVLSTNKTDEFDISIYNNLYTAWNVIKDVKKARNIDCLTFRDIQYEESNKMSQNANAIWNFIKHSEKDTFDIFEWNDSTVYVRRYLFYVCCDYFKVFVSKPFSEDKNFIAHPSILDKSGEYKVININNDFIYKYIAWFSYVYEDNHTKVYNKKIREGKNKIIYDYLDQLNELSDIDKLNYLINKTPSKITM